jgi:hypothetical protein
VDASTTSMRSLHSAAQRRCCARFCVSSEASRRSFQGPELLRYTLAGCWSIHHARAPAGLSRRRRWYRFPAAPAPVLRASGAGFHVNETLFRLSHFVDSPSHHLKQLVRSASPPRSAMSKLGRRHTASCGIASPGMRFMCSRAQPKICLAIAVAMVTSEDLSRPNDGLPTIPEPASGSEDVDWGRTPRSSFHVQCVVCWSRSVVLQILGLRGRAMGSVSSSEGR